MEKKITILGEDVTIAFNMATEMQWENVVNEPFSVEKLKWKKYVLPLYYAAIIANNPKSEITLEALATEATREEIQAIDDAVAVCLQEFLNIPKVVKTEEAQQTEGDQPKN